MNREEWTKLARKRLLSIADIFENYEQTAEELKRRFEEVKEPEDVPLLLMT